MKKHSMETALCKHCGARGLIQRDARGQPVEKMCVNGHPFEFDRTEQQEREPQRQ